MQIDKLSISLGKAVIFKVVPALDFSIKLWTIVKIRKPTSSSAKVKGGTSYRLPGLFGPDRLLGSIIRKDD